MPTGLTGVDEDQLRAFLALLRQFILKGSTNLSRISRLVMAQCGRPELCQWVEYAWKEWVKTLESRPLGIEIQGMRGILSSDDPGALDDGHWQDEFLYAKAYTISGGSNQIMQNLLGERALGLPREPK